MPTCYIVGAGDFTPRGFAPVPGDLVLAADGGYRALCSLGYTPDLLLGDFDSLGDLPLPPDLPVLRFPARKDDTDTGLALRHGLDRGYRDFALYGCAGGRVDHLLANLQSMARISRLGAAIRLAAPEYDAWALTGPAPSTPAPDASGPAPHAPDASAPRIPRPHASGPAPPPPPPRAHASASHISASHASAPSTSAPSTPAPHASAPHISASHASAPSTSSDRPRAHPHRPARPPRRRPALPPPATLFRPPRRPAARCVHGDSAHGDRRRGLRSPSPGRATAMGPAAPALPVGGTRRPSRPRAPARPPRPALGLAPRPRTALRAPAACAPRALVHGPPRTPRRSRARPPRARSLPPPAPHSPLANPRRMRYDRASPERIETR